MTEQLGTDLDVAIIGAGITGIDAAYHLSTTLPDKRFAVLEAHESFGGTWLLHTYPGVRSDTELYTLGFSFKPWTGDPYAGGAAILDYLGETIEEFDLGEHFFYNRSISGAAWSTEEQRWTISGAHTTTGEPFTVTAKFLWMCHGYYGHEQGHTPTWPGMEDFAGRWIHPQHWPEDAALGDQNVVVIGSGATMATLVPEIADECAHVTVVQRSPTYFFQSPNADPLADQLRGLSTPEEWIHQIIRTKAVGEMQAMTELQMSHPELSRAGLIQMVAQQLPADYDVETHFTPRHLPHEQRVCRILDGNLFTKISEGKVTMVTDEIARFTPEGLTTEGGTTVDADVVITATGFDLVALGGIAFNVDGQSVDFADTVTYRGMLFTGLPNLAWTFGSLRLSWTMRADLVNRFVIRLLEHLDELGATSVVPRLRPQDEGMELSPYIDPASFNPGYAHRSRAIMAKGGSSPEWQLDLDYWNEAEVLPEVDLDDGCLAYSRPGGA